jgi:hypothetical protein
VVQSSDAPCPVSFDRGSRFELEAELDEKEIRFDTPTDERTG